MPKPTYEELEQLYSDLQIRLTETIVAAEADARAAFLRGQEYQKNLPSVQA